MKTQPNIGIEVENKTLVKLLKHMGYNCAIFNLLQRFAVTCKRDSGLEAFFASLGADCFFAQDFPEAVMKETKVSDATLLPGVRPCHL